MNSSLWEKIREAINLIKNTPMVNKIEVVKKQVIVYAVPSQNNPKNLIRIDIKEE